LDKYESVIKVSYLINGTKNIGILEIGANISIINKSLVQELKLEIKLRGLISQNSNFQRKCSI
jgi:hypothetical protein